MSDRVIKALGATDEFEALRLVTEASEFMQAVHAVTGVTTYADSLSVLKTNADLTKQILATTEKPAAEALGVILAWKTDAAKVPDLNARVSTLEEEGRTRDVDALIKMGLETGAPSELNPHAGKLTKPQAEYLRDTLKLNADQLTAYLKTKGREIPMPAKPGNADVTATGVRVGDRVCDSQNRTYEQIPTPERAALKKSDPDLFNVLRSDWEAAGKPSAQAASAAN
jgi:hypothetical protein